MNKQFIFISGLFALGILVGVVIMNVGDDEKPARITSAGEMPVVGTKQPSSTPWSVITDSDTSRNVELENKIAELESRIVELEQAVSAQPVVTKNVSAQLIARQQFMNRLLTTKALIKGGVSEDMAAALVRRRNDIELRRLELRDRAAREGFLGTKRYMSEYSLITAEETTLREDLGDDAYDQYLFANGQPNRVKVSSVMLGSAAEEAGMKDGDVILTYGENRMFEGNELKRATTQGELGEYVNVDISRDGQLMSLWVPRGPLGVRLGIARVAP